MKLFYILNQTNPHVNNLIKKACKKKHVEFVNIDENTFDFTDIPNTSKHLLYRASTTRKSTKIEQNLLTKKTITFRIETPNKHTHSGVKRDSIILSKSKIPTPKAIEDLPISKATLEKYVRFLGGFPIIIKATGKSHGVGVMKVDSISSLVSVSGFLSKNTPGNFNMIEFVKTGSSARLIVLGNKVIDSIKYIVPDNEFRSNVGNNPIVQPHQFSKEIEEIAIKATHSLGFNFGGVDILTNAKGRPSVAEVNFPCNFARAEMLTKTNIAEQMISFLLKKSKNI